MRAVRSLVAAGAVLAAVCAARAQPEELPRGRVVSELVASGEPAQRYALYLPTDYDRRPPRPLLLVLDPGGAAEAALELFRPAAERRGWLVASLHPPATEDGRLTAAVIDAVVADAGRRLRFDARRLYLAGTAETAWAAWLHAARSTAPVAGVVAASAGLPPRWRERDWLELGGEVGFAWCGTAGTTDFSLRRVERLADELAGRGADWRLIGFEGGHGWPLPPVAAAAVDWLELVAMARGLAARDPRFIDRQLEAALVAARAAPDALAALERWREIVRDFGELRPVEEARAAVDRLERDPEVERLAQLEERLGSEEAVYRSARFGLWLNRLEREAPPPPLGWALFDLRVQTLKRLTADPEPRAARSAARLLEGLYYETAGVLPDRLLDAGDTARAIHALRVAIAVFPARPLARWRLAEAYAVAGRTRKALAALRVAVSLAPVDPLALAADPLWEKLRAERGWDDLMRSLAERRQQ